MRNINEEEKKRTTIIVFQAVDNKSISGFYKKNVSPQSRIVDPHWSNADPDPAFFLIADPDPDTDAEPDPEMNPRFWWPKIGKNLQLKKNWIPIFMTKKL